LLGQRARTTDTGENHTGTIAGYVRAYLWLAGRSPHSFHKWDELFPGWENGNVIYIELDEPQRACTIEEYLYGLKHKYGVELPKDKVEESYRNDVPEQKFVACPEVGVEILQSLVEA
jgi:hypothetical protein